MTGFWQTLRYDSDRDSWEPIPGSEYNESFRAIRAAQAYHETTGIPTCVRNQHSATVWSSSELHTIPEPRE